MSASFLSLPRELRDKVYELCLLDQEALNPWTFKYLGQELTTGLFYANKIIHSEATSLFYARNGLDFTMTRAEDIVLFLETIGCHNAGHIQDIRIDFPDFKGLEAGHVTIDEASDKMLTKIHHTCSKLSTLTTSLDSTNAVEIKLDKLDAHNIVVEALNLVDIRFKAIPSLQNIIVEVFEDGPSDFIRKEITNHRWTINTTKYVQDEDSDSAFRDFDDYDHSDHYYYDDDDDNDYDIDNDSDFWRRAAD